MSRSMWDDHRSEKWRVGNLDWLTDGQRYNDSRWPWIAMSPTEYEGNGHRFATHAEAVTYAQEHAKTQALKEPS